MVVAVRRHQKTAKMSRLTSVIMDVIMKWLISRKWTVWAVVKMMRLTTRRWPWWQLWSTMICKLNRKYFKSYIKFKLDVKKNSINLMNATRQLFSIVNARRVLTDRMELIKRMWFVVRQSCWQRSIGARWEGASLTMVGSLSRALLHYCRFLQMNKRPTKCMKMNLNTHSSSKITRQTFPHQCIVSRGY